VFCCGVYPLVSTPICTIACHSAGTRAITVKFDPREQIPAARFANDLDRSESIENWANSRITFDQSLGDQRFQRG
jgi:hypothetical protein